MTETEEELAPSPLFEGVSRVMLEARYQDDLVALSFTDLYFMLLASYKDYSSRTMAQMLAADQSMERLRANNRAMTEQTALERERLEKMTLKATQLQEELDTANAMLKERAVWAGGKGANPYSVKAGHVVTWRMDATGFHQQMKDIDGNLAAAARAIKGVKERGRE